MGECAWSAAAAARLSLISVTAVTTYYLIHDAHQHFPYRILFRQVVAAILMQVAGKTYASARKRPLDEHDESAFYHINYMSLLSRRRLAHKILFVACLLAGYQSLFHLSSPMCLALVLSLAPACASAITRLLNSPTCVDVAVAIATYTCVCAVYWNDYRLTPNGITFCTLSLILYIAADYVQPPASADISVEQAGDRIDESIIILLLLLGCTLCGIVIREEHPDQRFHPERYPVILAVNSVVGGLTLLLNLPSFGKVQSPRECTSKDFIPVFLPGAIFVIHSAMGHKSIVSLWQLLAFAVAISLHLYSQRKAFKSTIDIHTDCRIAKNNELVAFGWLRKVWSNEDTYKFGSDHEQSRDLDRPAINTRLPYKIGLSRQVITPFIWLIYLSGSIFMLYTAAINAGVRIHSTLVNSNNAHFLNGHTIDVVVAHYDEPIDGLVTDVNTLLSLEKLSSTEIRLFLYTKGDKISNVTDGTVLEAGLPGIREVKIGQLKNVGEEGDTFLHHMLDVWNDLASHTIFMQAQPHNTWYARRRVNDYFIKNTGFLSLWHMDEFCRDCERCHDHSTWSEDADVLKSLYSDTNAGAPCQDVLLTYRGQFITSRERIRSNERTFYESLRARLSQDRPLVSEFGYTLERMWGTIMKCPGNERIADRCPSLASGLVGAFYDVEDCQCLDDV